MSKAPRGTTILLALALALSACGSAKRHDETIPATGHSEGSEQPKDQSSGLGDSSATPSSADSDAAPTAPVTFMLKNSGRDDLTINMDKGWGAVISAHSGTPPAARALVMFPPTCTTTCEAGLCPVCDAPQQAAAILKAEKHDAVVPGDEREVPWDGLAVFVKDSMGLQGAKSVPCKCTTSGPPEPETYTAKACGLRKTHSAKQPSRYQCVTATFTLPVSEPIRVELDFGP